MGKMLGALKFKGKFNDAVGYVNKNAAKADAKFAVRNRVSEVKNPKTTAQALQRMKVAPAQNLYRALAVLLDHSWQGVKYGTRSHAEFSKRAMLMKSGFPYVVKGDKKPWPGTYDIASGSLVSIPFTFDDNAVSLNVSLDSNITTVGQLSTEILGYFPQLQEGDQLTFVVCQIKNGFPMWSYARIILNKTDATTRDEWKAANGFDFNTAANDEVAFFPVGDNTALSACSVIISRAPRIAGGAWQRNNAKLKLSDAYYETYFTDEKFEAAYQSYMEREASVSDSSWYLNEGKDADFTQL